MTDYHNRSSNFNEILSRPEVGTILTILSGLAFLLLSMILPLVGKSGVKTVHYTTNFSVFLLILLLTTALSGLAIKSKLQRRKKDGSPYPVFSFIICGLCVLLLVSLLAGLLKI